MFAWILVTNKFGTQLAVHTTMKAGFILSLLLLFTCASQGQVNTAPAKDTQYLVHLNEVDILAQRKWKNDTLRYRYNQMKYYVTTILPYLDAATTLFNEMNAKLAVDDLSRRQRKQYMKSREKEMKEHFEDEIYALNITQGTLLIKLIGRQTGLNVYDLISEYKNPLAAIKWQTWARINGINLNKKYDPASEPDLEQIMESLHYPLPEFYKMQGDSSLTQNF